MTIKHFHEGELRLQEQTGMREKIGRLSEHLMRDFLPQQHRDFFGGLEYLFLATVDESGLPHASLVTGTPLFVSSPDPKSLVIRTGDRLGNSAFNNLCIGRSIGVLGIDLSNRRRNRMHGRIADMDDDSITVTVVQSYGNCPKYISLREITERGLSPSMSDPVQHDKLNAADTDLIKAADTFFIASYVSDGSAEPYDGMDINHRGGQPGFVSVDTPSQITIPDYKGNYLFNTFGNLLLNPEAGLLFVDFESGDQLHVHGRAELIEDAHSVCKFPEAQRLLRIQIQNVTRKSGATELRWRLLEASPFSPDARQIRDY